MHKKIHYITTIMVLVPKTYVFQIINNNKIMTDFSKLKSKKKLMYSFFFTKTMDN